MDSEGERMISDFVYTGSFEPTRCTKPYLVRKFMTSVTLLPASPLRFARSFAE